MKKLLGILIALASSSALAATTSPVQLLNPTGSTSGQAILSNGPSSAPTWGTLSAGSLAPINANTALANTTSASAAPSATNLPSCATSSNALLYTLNTGFSCNTAVNAAQLNGATFSAPGAIGSTTAGTGSFTTLSASSTVSGTGFSAYLASPPAIGGTAAAAGSFTTLSASSTVSGTGFSAYLASPPAIGSTAPSTGKFTTLQATSTITPATVAGIVGTTAADSAQAGSIGEYLTATTGSVSMSTGAGANCSSVSLTAGDWDVWGSIAFVPQATTTISAIQAGITTTSAGSPPFGNYQGLVTTFQTGNGQTLGTPVVRINVSTTTTAYVVGQATFGTSTMTCSGNINARRVR